MLDKSQITCLLWDIDGTLIDTMAIIVSALGRVFKEYLGRDVPSSELRALIGIPLEDQVRIFGDPSLSGAVAADMEAAAIRYYEQQRNQEHPIAEALDALIDAKRRGMKTALVTSKSDVELAHTLPRLGISAYCDAIIGADQVAPFYKPHPRPVLLALQQLAVASPSEALFIGDSLYDFRSGRSAGVKVGAVLWGAAPSEMVRAEKPDIIFEHPMDLLAFARSLKPAAARIRQPV